MLTLRAFLTGEAYEHTWTWLVVGLGATLTMALSYIFASQFPKVQAVMTTLVASALALNIWLLAAYSNPYSGERNLSPSMFSLLKETVFVTPDGPSRFLHDDVSSVNRSVDAASSPKLPQTTVKYNTPSTAREQQ